MEELLGCSEADLVELAREQQLGVAQRNRVVKQAAGLKAEAARMKAEAEAEADAACKQAEEHAKDERNRVLKQAAELKQAKAEATLSSVEPAPEMEQATGAAAETGPQACALGLDELPNELERVYRDTHRVVLKVNAPYSGYVHAVRLRFHELPAGRSCRWYRLGCVLIQYARW